MKYRARPVAEKLAGYDGAQFQRLVGSGRCKPQTPRLLHRCQPCGKNHRPCPQSRSRGRLFLAAQRVEAAVKRVVLTLHRVKGVAQQSLVSTG